MRGYLATLKIFPTSPIQISKAIIQPLAGRGKLGGGEVVGEILKNVTVGPISQNSTFKGAPPG